MADFDASPLRGLAKKAKDGPQARRVLALLQDRNSGVHVAFVQGGVSNSNQASEVLSLGRINYQLFWVFHRATETVDEVAQLKGKRIAVGPIGSGTQVVAAKILGVSGVNADTATLLPLAGQKGSQGAK